ncbi:hypothetical protein H4Q26_000595 [Puccinia striiformis f. sp. tritici PST-130]|nr:hypothetical protein H4Q26_000595 [Puccinia striiformis f. sp. tritici PST-130]
MNGLNITAGEDPEYLCKTSAPGTITLGRIGYEFLFVYIYKRDDLELGAIRLCEHVYGRDWYALVAAQNWNNFVNVLFQASGDAYCADDVLIHIMVFGGSSTRGTRNNLQHYQDVIQAGISTNKGLASLNQDGIFLSEIPVIDRETVQKEYETMIKLKTLVKVWREQFSKNEALIRTK